MEIKTTLSFIKAIHRVPKRQKVTWALIPIEGTPNYSLGVILIGTDKVINLKTGRFEQSDGSLKCLFATRRTVGDWYEYDAGTAVLRLPKYYVSDMYYARVYNQDMMDSYLL